MPGLNQVLHRGGLLSADPAATAHAFAFGGDRFICSLCTIGGSFHQAHLVTGCGTSHGDAAPHGATTYHGNLFDAPDGGGSRYASNLGRTATGKETVLQGGCFR